MLRKIKLALGFLSSLVRWLRNKSYILCIVSAILLAFSFPRNNFWILAWFGFVPLFFALQGKSKGKAFLLAYFCGVIFWLGIIYWLVHVTLLGTILLILYLAFYFGVFGLTIRYPLSAIRYNIIFIPSAWVILEYIRSHLFSGFPWALLGYSQYLNLPAIQIADITGAWGVSFLVMMVNVMIREIIGYTLHATRYTQKNVWRNLLVAFSAWLVACGYGYYKICLSPIAYHLSPIKVSVIQGNIPQELKWEPGAKTYILDKYARLTKEAADSGTDLIVWPEASAPGLLGEDEEVFSYISTLSKKIKLPLIIGAVVRDNEKYFNSALLVESGQIVSRYDKLHLVPFGEYIPLKRVFPFLQTIVPIGDINEGDKHTIFEVKNSDVIEGKGQRCNFAVLICFEDLFPGLSREFKKRGADFLVNITNDAWYKQTSAPYQHLEASVFRAVENRIFVVRAANTGVSGFIDPKGKIISLVQDASGKDIFVDGFKTEEIRIPKKNLSFYSRYGDIFVAACFLFIIYGIIRAFKK